MQQPGSLLPYRQQPAVLHYRTVIQHPQKSKDMTKALLWCKDITKYHYTKTVFFTQKCTKTLLQQCRILKKSRDYRLGKGGAILPPPCTNSWRRPWLNCLTRRKNPCEHTALRLSNTLESALLSPPNLSCPTCPQTVPACLDATSGDEDDKSCTSSVPPHLQLQNAASVNWNNSKLICAAPWDNVD